MTTSVLYPVIMDLTFSSNNVAYIIFEEYACRKMAGPRLQDLFEEYDIELVKATTSEWTIKVQGVFKYLRMIIPSTMSRIAALDSKRYSIIYLSC